MTTPNTNTNTTSTTLPNYLQDYRTSPNKQTNRLSLSRLRRERTKRNGSIRETDPSTRSDPVHSRTKDYGGGTEEETNPHNEWKMESKGQAVGNRMDGTTTEPEFTLENLAPSSSSSDDDASDYAEQSQNEWSVDEHDTEEHLPPPSRVIQTKRRKWSVIHDDSSSSSSSSCSSFHEIETGRRQRWSPTNGNPPKPQEKPIPNEYSFDNPPCTPPTPSKTYQGLRRIETSPFYPPTQTHCFHQETTHGLDRGTFSPEKLHARRYQRQRTGVGEPYQVEPLDSTDDESDGADDGSGLIVLPPSPKRPPDGWSSFPVVDLSNSSDEEHRLPRRSPRSTPKHNHARMERSDPGLSWLPRWSGPPSVRATSSSSSLKNSMGANERRRALTSLRIAPRDITTEFRNDLKGGSGTGLGGVIMERAPRSDRSRKRSRGTKGEEEEVVVLEEVPQADSTKSKSKTTGRAKPKKKTRARPKTTKRRRKTTRTKAYTRRKKTGSGTANRSTNGSNAWSARERGIRPYRGRSSAGSGSGSGGRRGSSTQPYMDIGGLDPNLGNVGGASIKYE